MYHPEIIDIKLHDVNDGAFEYLHSREDVLVLCVGRSHMDFCWSEKLTAAETMSCPCT